MQRTNLLKDIVDWKALPKRAKQQHAKLQADAQEILNDMQEAFKTKLAQLNPANSEILGPTGENWNCYCCKGRGRSMSTKIVDEAERTQLQESDNKRLKLYKFVNFQNAEAVRGAALMTARDIPTCSRHLNNTNLRAFMQNDSVFWASYWADLELAKKLLELVEQIAQSEDLMRAFGITAAHDIEDIRCKLQLTVQQHEQHSKAVSANSLTFFQWKIVEQIDDFSRKKDFR